LGMILSSGVAPSLFSTRPDITSVSKMWSFVLFIIHCSLVRSVFFSLGLRLPLSSPLLQPLLSSCPLPRRTAWASSPTMPSQHKSFLHFNDEEENGTDEHHPEPSPVIDCLRLKDRLESFRISEQDLSEAHSSESNEDDSISCDKLPWPHIVSRISTIK
jgi:hypothetical protein